jgi:hypothetical protein
MSQPALPDAATRCCRESFFCNTVAILQRIAAWGAKKLAQLVTIVSYAERGLYAITGTKNRERGRYCGGSTRYPFSSPFS